MKALPRGIRNNNPGNIRDSKTQWVGESKANNDKSFEEFESPVYGIRALAKLLINYQKQNLDTIQDIINRYAPPVENNTSSYVSFVEDFTKISRHKVINLSDPVILTKVVRAIVIHENGQGPLFNGDWYNQEIYNTAINLALE